MEDLGLEVNANSKLRVWINGEQRALSSDSVPAGTDITYKFTWTASTKRYTFEAFSGGTSNASATSGTNYYSTLTSSAGSKTVNVRAINSDTTNYEPSNYINTSIYVYTISVSATNGTISPTPTQANVIAGTSFTTSGQTVTIPRGTSSATFTASKTDKAGYTTTFSGWNPTSGTVNSNTSIVATFTRAAIDYTISYNLNKGSVSTANPAGYNVETATFTLNNPTKTITIKGNENSTSEANGTGVTIGSNTSKAQTP